MSIRKVLHSMFVLVLILTTFGFPAKASALPACDGAQVSATIKLSGQTVIGTATGTCANGATGVPIRLKVELWKNNVKVTSTTDKSCHTVCSATAQLGASGGDWVAKATAYTSDTPSGRAGVSRTLRCVYNASLGKVTCSYP